jgi:hypothetical protein
MSDVAPAKEIANKKVAANVPAPAPKPKAAEPAAAPSPRVAAQPNKPEPPRAPEIRTAYSAAPPASGNGLLAGAQPVVPVGSFDDRFNGFR